MTRSSGQDGNSRKGPSPTHRFGHYVKRTSTDEIDPQRAIEALERGLAGPDLCLILLFISPAYDRSRMLAALPGRFNDVPVIGCTTAGEITEQGYAEGHMVAVGFPSEHFTAACALVTDLNRLAPKSVVEAVLELRNVVASEQPSWHVGFAFLVSDGLSLKEDQLVSALSTALGPIPLFGGSAGDGLDFKETQVLYGGEFHSDAAVIALFRTRCRIRVFKYDHFLPTDRQMVVTDADPDNRLVKEINAEPAAREYARMVGKDPDRLSPFIFAANPVVVKLGDGHHVRSIQKVEENGYLRFFSAIDEGLVLTVAEASDIAQHLEALLADLNKDSPVDTILACDCILRRLEIEQIQAGRRISSILSSHGVVGFNTYGEQINMLHVNQTFTGVAFYPPSEGRD